MDKLPEALLKSDIVVLTLPLNDSTKHLFNKDLFKKFRKESILVNIARGAVVNEPDLIEAPQTGILGGAPLDVFEAEPLSESSPLWNIKNVIVTPHNSFASPNNGKRLFEAVYNNLKENRDGKIL